MSPKSQVPTTRIGTVAFLARDILRVAVGHLQPQNSASHRLHPISAQRPTHTPGDPDNQKQRFLNAQIRSTILFMSPDAPLWYPRDPRKCGIILILATADKLQQLTYIHAYIRTNWVSKFSACGKAKEPHANNRCKGRVKGSRIRACVSAWRAVSHAAGIES